MKDLLKALDKICISNLADFEERMDGKKVLIEKIKPNGDIEFDEIKIVLEKISMETAIKQKNFNQKFKEYQLIPGSNAHDAKLQKLNYDEFLQESNDLLELVTDYLQDSKSELYSTLDIFIEENFSNEKLISYALNSRLIVKIKASYLELFNNFNFQTNSYNIVYLDGTNSEPKLFESLLSVLDVLDGLIKDLKVKYKFFFDEDYFKNDFDYFLEKELEDFQPSQESPENFENKLWFKVGLNFANGKISQFYEEEGGNFTKLAKRISSSKWSSYRPYISESWNNTTNSDKNIFSNLKKINSVKEFCRNKDIKISDSFLSRCSS